MTGERLYFENFARGDRWELPAFTLEADEIVGFARRWDPQPYHVDEAAAAESVFGGLIASGMHTLVTLVRLQYEVLMHRTAAAAGMGFDQLRFLAPARAGETLHGELEVLETSVRDGGRPWGLLVMAMRARDAGDAVILTAENRILVWLRETAR